MTPGRRRVGRRQAREGQRAEQQAEVAQGDVAVAADEQQVEDDAAQPRGDEQAAEARSEQDDEAGDDLDDTNHVHGGGGAAGDDVVELAGQVTGPVVRQDIGELVDAEQDRRHGEGDPHQQVGLGRGLPADGLARREGKGPQQGGRCSAHVGVGDRGGVFLTG